MERCLLLENAQKLAKQKHLNTQEVKCGLENTCEGTVCIYLAEEGQEHSTYGQNRFYKRLQGWKQIHDQRQGVDGT